MPKMPFGKYKGVEFTSIPSSYLQWMIKYLESCPDIVANAKKALAAMSEFEEQDTLEAEADRILKAHGCASLASLRSIPRGYRRKTKGRR